MAMLKCAKKAKQLQSPGNIAANKIALIVLNVQGVICLSIWNTVAVGAWEQNTFLWHLSIHFVMIMPCSVFIVQMMKAEKDKETWSENKTYIRKQKLNIIYTKPHKTTNLILSPCSPSFSPHVSWIGNSCPDISSQKGFRQLGDGVSLNSCWRGYINETSILLSLSALKPPIHLYREQFYIEDKSLSIPLNLLLFFL